MYRDIAGMTLGSAGGLYNGTVSVAAIPEPEIWAMLLVGTGLVSFQLRRKNRHAIRLT